jgi:hypothetical protein
MQGTVMLYMAKYLNVVPKVILLSKRVAGQKWLSKMASSKIYQQTSFIDRFGRLL